MDSDGKNPRNLTNSPEADDHPCWSPDGQRIAFTSTRGGNAEIYIMDADGRNPHNITAHPETDGDPDWFDPAYAYAVSSAGKLKRTWGWLKQNSE